MATARVRLRVSAGSSGQRPSVNPSLEKVWNKDSTIVQHSRPSWARVQVFFRNAEVDTLQPRTHGKHAGPQLTRVRDAVKVSGPKEREKRRTLGSTCSGLQPTCTHAQTTTLGDFGSHASRSSPCGRATQAHNHWRSQFKCNPRFAYFRSFGALALGKRNLADHSPDRARTNQLLLDSLKD